MGRNLHDGARLALTGLAALAATGAAAQVTTPIGDGIYARGGVEVEHYIYDDEEATGAYLDMDIGIATGTLFGLPVGVELGAEGFSEDESESAFYGAAVLDTGFGLVGAGVPRFALDKYMDTPQIGGFRLIEVLDFGLIDGQGLSGLYYLAASEVPYGLSYDLVRQNVAVGVTYHEFEDDGPKVLQGVVRGKAGMVELSLGGEYLDAEGGDSTFLTGSAEFQTARFDLGASYVTLDASVDFGEWLEDDVADALASVGLDDLSASGDVTSTKVWATVRPLDRLDVTASYMSFEEGKADVWGVSARYALAGAFIEAGAIDGIGDETLVQASFGLDF